MSHEYKSKLLEVKGWYNNPLGKECKRSCNPQCAGKKESTCFSNRTELPSVTCERNGPFAWLVGGNDNLALPNEQEEPEGGYTFGIIESEGALATASVNYRTSDLIRARLYGDAANEISGYQEPMAGRFVIANGAIGWVNVPTTTLVLGVAPDIATNVYLERPSNAYTMIVTAPMVNPAVVGPPPEPAHVDINDILMAPQLLGATNLFLATTPPYQSFFFTMKITLDAGITPPTNLAPLELRATTSFMTSLTSTIYGPNTTTGYISAFNDDVNTIILNVRAETDAIGLVKYFLFGAIGYLV